MITGFEEALGRHILAEFFDCDAEALNDLALLEKSMVEAASEAGATVITSTFHPFSPVGISGVVLIKESHLAIHTWPENAYAAVDFFTCTPRMDFEVAYNKIVQVLKPRNHFYTVVPRGEMRFLGKLS